MKNLKAFTLIETLIVVFIFGVGILAVLRLLTYSLGYFDSIDMRVKANFLAKEGLEIVYNIRDSKIEQWYTRNYIQEKFEDDTLKQISLGDEGFTNFKVGFSGSGNYYIFEPAEKSENFMDNFRTFYLNFFTGEDNQELTYYSPLSLSSSEEPYKGFARIIEYSPIYVGDQPLDKNKILKISSRVLYKRGGNTGEVLLESFIGMKDSLPAEL